MKKNFHLNTVPSFFFIILKNEQIQAVLRECRISKTCTLALIWKALSMIKPVNPSHQVQPPPIHEKRKFNVDSGVQRRRSLFGNRPFYYELVNERRRSIFQACRLCGMMTINEEREACISRCIGMN